VARTITRDIIGAISGPGWRYSKARILIDPDMNAAVFVPGNNGPVQTFKVTDLQSMKGVGVTSQGDAVSWRRTGSGCSWQYAKCRVNEAVLAAQWA
jgi:hypothetical protein